MIGDVGLAVTQDLLGHSTPQMTRRYAHIEGRRGAAAAGGLLDKMLGAGE